MENGPIDPDHGPTPRSSVTGMRTRGLRALAVAAVVALALGACGGGNGSTTKSGAQLITSGTLTDCSDVPYAPFEDFDKSSPTGFKGFDIDLLTEIAKGLDLKLVVKDSAFDPLQSGLALNSGQCDIVASAMTITPDREKNLDFSDGYAQGEPVPARPERLRHQEHRRPRRQEGRASSRAPPARPTPRSTPPTPTS